MKKLLLIGLLLASTIVLAQKKINIKKGTLSFGGQVSFNSSEAETTTNNATSTNSKSTGISLNPEIGYTLKDNLILGLGLGYSYYEYENIDVVNSNTSRNTLSISPYVKKLFPVNKNLLLSLKGQFSFSKNEYEYNSPLNNHSEKGFFIGLRPGITYFISKRLSLEANIGAIGYNHYTRIFDSNTNYEESTTNSFNFNINSSNLLFGFTYFLK